MIIKSSIRDYECVFDNIKKEYLDACDFFVIDENISNLYKDIIDKHINYKKILLIKAIETNKTYEKCQIYISNLLEMGIKRGNTIGCIGGGIIQDITGFISSILFRGVSWHFFPTTLLAQSDSCIGGKTSINLGKFKNIVGNFNPPKKIVIDTNFLKTLSKKQLLSGFGEIIKVNFLDPKKRINNDSLMNDLFLLLKDKKINIETIKNALLIKKEIIEIDEFDNNIRNIMNYGHTFGHAIETITKFKIDHGIAVVIGMYIENELSKKIIKKSNVNNLQYLLKYFLNYCGEEIKILKKEFTTIDFINTLKKDKKNKSINSIVCILSSMQGKMFKKSLDVIKLKNIIENNMEDWLENVN